MESTENKQKKKPPQKPSVVNVRWVVTIMAVSFVLSVVMSYISNGALNSAGTVLSFVVLFFFIGLGIVFDMIGVAATSGTEKEFHSMAAHKVRGAREAVCIHTKKIYSSCRDKDCIEDLRFYPTATAQSVLSTAQGLRGGSAELIYTFVDVEPVNFNRGYYTVDMHFFYRITLQALNGSTRYTEIEGLATFDKRVVLFGSESGAKIYSSIPEANAIDAPLNLTANLPTAVVEVVDPMLLCAHFADNCNCRCGCDRGTLGGVPAGILAAFDEPIIFDESAIRRVCISLGQFSTVRLERDTQLLIPVYDYCIPSNECTLAGGDCSCEDPCKVFDAVEFPMDDFFPPAAMPNGGCGCACPCGNQ